MNSFENNITALSDVSQILPESWAHLLAYEHEKSYLQKLLHQIHTERSQGRTIYPKQEDIFQAFMLTLPASLSVVILGQDPYHGPGQAHGLAFSVQDGIPLPPSLQNIFKELQADLAIPPRADGNLTRWAHQGVLLLNAVLTVEESNPGSHAGHGWEQFTDAVISHINTQMDNVVFMLWGAYAQKKGAHIDQTRHCILKAAHPSPLSAYRGFLGCKHFSQANNYLRSHRRQEIIW